MATMREQTVLPALPCFWGVLGLLLGYPLADPLIGLLITNLIFQIVWEAGKPLISYMLDGVEPEIVD
jgi:divalent metal cation (Fe/Co/Zn/Cd) transporter